MKTLKKLTSSERYDLVKYVKETFDSYAKDLKIYQDNLMEIYKEINKTQETATNEWDTRFHVNKMREIENKVTPKIMAKNPRFIVSWRTDAWEEGDETLAQDKREEKIKSKRDLPLALQDYLSQMFEKQEMRKKFKLFAKSGVRYGTAWGKVYYKNEDEGGTPMIDIKSFADMYFDPRYTTLDEMPAIIELVRSVRISELEASGKYDEAELKTLKDIKQEKDPTLKRQLIEQYAGIQNTNEVAEPDLTNLELKIYEGYDVDDNFVRITTVSDYILIWYEEIEDFSYEEFRVFEDTETFFAKGFVEWVMGLQREQNWKKNAASEYINHSLNRTWVLSPNAGIDPAELFSWPWHLIIPESINAREVIDQHLVELPHRELPMQYFNEQNDFERQIQAASYTIDIANRSPWVGQTNTATGEKIQYSEMNDVVNDVRVSFEDALARIAYKILNVTYENMDTNIYFKSSKKGFWKLHKEAFKDALRRFDIKIEANSSSSVDVESRRADAIAKKNIIAEAVQVGAMTAEQAKEAYKEILNTFEGTDVEKYFADNLQLPMLWVQWGQPQGMWGMWQPQKQPVNPMAIGNPPTLWSIQ